MKKIIQYILIASAFIMGQSMAAEIKVIASVAFKDAYLAMVPEFEKSTGNHVTTLWLPTVEIMSRLKAGEPCDLVIIAQNGINDLIKDGKIKLGSSNPYAKSGIGIGMRKESIKPDISSADSFKTALMNAKSVAYSTGPSGAYLVSLFEKMGLTAALAPKLKIIQGEPVGAVVARGDAEIGLQQVPEILSVPAIDFVGPLPPEIQFITTFSFGVHEKVGDTAATQAWMNALKTPQSATLLKKYGLDPAW
jgi:molybdate transport system substrate-binding protein